MASNRHVLLAAAACLSLSACIGSSDGGSSSTVMQGKFGSLNQCLSSIRSKSGLEPKPVTDTPQEVSGFLGGTRRGFACTLRSTGTQGVYWEGWYSAG